MRKSRWCFWWNIIRLAIRYPAVVTNYLSVCAQEEHFLEYRSIVREQIEAQLDEYLADQKRSQAEVLPEIQVPVS